LKLLYSTTTTLVTTISDRYYSSSYYLYFAEQFNAWPNNPPSSNPFQIFLDYAEILRTNDVRNPKFIAHKRSVQRGIRKKLGRSHPDYSAAVQSIRAFGIHAIQPHLAILELDTYEYNHRTTLSLLPPTKAGSPTSREYFILDIYGPSHSSPEMHLQRLHF
jgi:hypothetical protein